MIDFSKIEQYRENNRIEAKKALGVLPRSIWETYSAFANTHGGIILLGVEEWADKSLHTVDLPDPDRLIKEFWDIVNNPNKTSVNVLSSKDVFVQEVDGNHIVVINVPRAKRSYKPVYVDGNPLCTYRRNGEGDYRCTKEEYQAMVRDASVKTQDMLVLDEMDMTVFNQESIRSYRQRMRLSRPGHVWEALEDEDFLLKLGAVGIGPDGKKHPTSAGLLMFGNEYDIVREFNAYFLDYQEQYDADTRWTDRIISSSGDWSGNVYEIRAFDSQNNFIWGRLYRVYCSGKIANVISSNRKYITGRYEDFIKEHNLTRIKEKRVMQQYFNEEKLGWILRYYKSDLTPNIDAFYSETFKFISSIIQYKIPFYTSFFVSILKLFLQKNALDASLDLSCLDAKKITLLFEDGSVYDDYSKLIDYGVSNDLVMKLHDGHITIAELQEERYDKSIFDEYEQLMLSDFLSIL